MKKVYINGYFTCEHMNGVPRYAMEIVKRLDQYFKPGEAELVIPPNANNVPSLKNIEICTWQDRGGKKESVSPMWGLLTYGPYVRKNKGLNVNFSNRAEWVQGSITALHDTISLKNYKYEFKLSLKEKINIYKVQFINKLWFRNKIFIKKHTAKKVVTVSEFSKEELCREFGFDSNCVSVIGNGWEHINNIIEKDECLDKRIVDGNYYFFIGNLYPHKNLKWIFDEAKRLPDENFVIAGKLPYSLVSTLRNMKNIIFLGYISDEYMKYLMANCKALLFPSFIEGFGIPPLEALALGSKAIISDIPVMHEIYEESAYYIDPNNGTIDLNELLNSEKKENQNTLRKHSWDIAAMQWFKLIEEERGA